MTRTPQAPSNLGPFTTLAAAIQPDTSTELLEESYQLLGRIEPLLAHANDDTREQAEELRDRILVHLGNPNNH